MSRTDTVKSERGANYDLDHLSLFDPQSLPAESDLRPETSEEGLKTQRSKEEEMRELFLYLQIKPLLLLFRFSGNFPLKQTPCGVEFKLFSLPFLYALVCYICIVPIVIMLIHDVAFSENKTERSLLMFNELFIPIMATYPILPLTTWQNLPQLAAYLNKWTEFQKLYLKTTRRNLDLKIDKIVRNLKVVVPVGALFNAFIGAVALDTRFILFTIVAFGLNSMLYFSFISYWIISCMALSAACENLARRFKADMTSSNNRSPRVIANYQTLWLDLSGLAQSTGYAMYRVIIVGAVLSMWFMTISLYALPLAYKQKDYFSFIICCLSSTATIVINYFTYSMGYSIPMKIKKSIQTELHVLNTTNLSSSAWLQMIDFLRATHVSSPVLTMGGFANIDRKVFQAIIATIFTYLIVVMQFRGSQYSTSLNNVE